MAYTAWSVVYGEQPTAAKWNQLGANDAVFKDGTNIDNNAIITRHLGSAANLQIPLSRLDATTILDDSYSASGVAAAGEFVDTLRKTYDITNIPTGHAFVVSARNYSGDSAGFRNVTAVIGYNGTSYKSDNWGQYHNTAFQCVPLIKVSGQNSVTISFGGSGASQNHQSRLTQMN